MHHTPYRRFIYRFANYARGLDPQEKFRVIYYLPGVSVPSKTFRNEDTHHIQELNKLVARDVATSERANKEVDNKKLLF
jgi:hypothetical protein